MMSALYSPPILSSCVCASVFEDIISSYNFKGWIVHAVCVEICW